MAAKDVRILQCNLGRSLAAQHEIVYYFKESTYNVLLLQEPYHGNAIDVQCIYDLDVFQFPSASNHVKACVVLKEDVGPAIGWTQHSSPNLAIVQIRLRQRTLFLTSAYIEPDVDSLITAERLDVFLKSKPDAIHIIGMDANGSHHLWNCTSCDGRGDNIANIAASNGLSVLNSGDVPTFQSVTHGASCTSIPDVTLASDSIVDSVRNWHVNLEACAASDHNAIEFTVSTQLAGRPEHRTSTYYFNNKTADWNKFHASLKLEMETSGLLEANNQSMPADEIDDVVVHMTDVIRRACQTSMKIRGTGRPTNQWWTP